MGERRPLNGAKKVVLCGLMASTLTVLKMVLSPLPNIEPVSLLILVYALVFGRQVLSIILPFVVVEGLLYGFNPMWWLGYLYVWPLWGLICTKLPPGRPLLLAMASGHLWTGLRGADVGPLLGHRRPLGGPVLVDIRYPGGPAPLWGKFCPGPGVGRPAVSGPV